MLKKLKKLTKVELNNEPPLEEVLKADIKSDLKLLIKEVGKKKAVKFLDSLIAETTATPEQVRLAERIVDLIGLAKKI